MRAFFVLISIAFASNIFAYSPIETLPPGSKASLSVETKNNSLLSINTDKLFPPASTLKIITALAAKLELGDEFRFITQIESSGDDIIIRFAGDPTLTSQDLDNLLSDLSKQGVKQIKGDIWLNNGVFSGYERGIGWPWDILGVCYSAPSSAITLDGNCVQASIYTNSDGTTRVYVPEHQPITVNTNAISVSKQEQQEKQCQLELMTFNNNEYQLSGCLVQQKKPLPLKFAVQQTRFYTEAKLRALLVKNKIVFDGEIFVNDLKQGTVIASHSSAPLSSILERMLKTSNNLMADNITKTIGSRFYLQPGSFYNGTEAIKQIIFSNTGVDLSDAQLVDGSGLSRNNRITASDISQVLKFIWQNDQQLHFIDMLPIAGESGTLQYRKSMRKAPIKGQLQAKSGSVYGTYNMAGFVLDEKRQPKAVFVQFVSDYFIKKEESNSKSLPPIFQFEHAFYQDLIKLSPKSNSLP